eukprot:1447840-Rhodomonas_salina.1
MKVLPHCALRVPSHRLLRLSIVKLGPVSKFDFEFSNLPSQKGRWAGQKLLYRSFACTPADHDNFLDVTNIVFNNVTMNSMMSQRYTKPGGNSFGLIATTA